MTLQELTEILKAQFDEISAALFKGLLNIEYLEETDRVFGEASTMFGANILRYSESNFEYFYLYHKHLLANLDIINLTVLNPQFPKLETKGDILSLSFIKQAESSDLVIPHGNQFLELNLVANVFPGITSFA